MTNTYSENDIKVLSEIEHVHKRSQVYLGTTAVSVYDVPIFADTFKITAQSFVPAVMKLFSEVVDNANDELIKFKPKNPSIKITANVETGEFSVEDNGRGVPIGSHETGRYTPEVVFSTLRSGRNFEDDEKEVGVIGTNGMGVSLSAICSEEFIIDIHRDNKRYLQVLRDATREIEPPKITKKVSKNTGTKITLKLKRDIFDDITLPYELVRNRAIELAASNPGLKIEFNSETFLYKKGFEQMLGTYFDKFQKFSDNDLDFFIVFDHHRNPEEQMFSWVNSSMLYDGGICNTQFMNAFVDKVSAHLEREAKKLKITINRNDIRHGLLVLGSLSIKNPQYDSQAKTKMTGPNIRKDIDIAINKSWTTFTKSNKAWFDVIIERAVARSNSAATKQIQKEQSGKKLKVEGLMDATSRKRETCNLLITEGLSAKASIVQSRDPETVAAYPLTGKLDNVYDAPITKLMKMGKIIDLLNIIGLVPGKRAMRSELRYGKVTIATDSDSDGSHILLLLINLFYKFWPELFDKKYPPFIFKMESPNIIAKKGDKEVYFITKAEFDAVKDQYADHKLVYNKGLGSLEKDQWERILNDPTSFVPIMDDGELSEVVKLMFSDDVDARKKWLSDTD